LTKIHLKNNLIMSRIPKKQRCSSKTMTVIISKKTLKILPKCSKNSKTGNQVYKVEELAIFKMIMKSKIFYQLMTRVKILMMKRQIHKSSLLEFQTAPMVVSLICTMIRFIIIKILMSPWVLLRAKSQRCNWEKVLKSLWSKNNYKIYR
jgi:hypothetical protein